MTLVITMRVDRQQHTHIDLNKQKPHEHARQLSKSIVLEVVRALKVSGEGRKAINLR